MIGNVSELTWAPFTKIVDTGSDSNTLEDQSINQSIIYPDTIFLSFPRSFLANLASWC